MWQFEETRRVGEKPEGLELALNLKAYWLEFVCHDNLSCDLRHAAISSFAALVISLLSKLETLWCCLLISSFTTHLAKDNSSALGDIGFPYVRQANTSSISSYVRGKPYNVLTVINGPSRLSKSGRRVASVCSILSV